MSNRAVHTKVHKNTGFVQIEQANKKVKLDDAMKNHQRDDKPKKKNPKKLEKSMSLQVREYLAQVEEKVAKIPAKEIGLKFGYDIDDENKTLDDLIKFTEKVSQACNQTGDIADNRQQVWQSTVHGLSDQMNASMGATYEEYVKKQCDKFETIIEEQEQAEMEAAMEAVA